MINYLDLFSGIGGFTKGLLEAGIEFNWHGYSEIDQYAEQIYAKHFPNAERLGDVTKINPSILPKLNLITFGFPCQDLSVAGNREGLQASRSGLFFEATRIIKVIRPDYFIFENVKGIFSSNNGADFIRILQEIANIGYDGQWQLLNTRWFLPQNRERVYFVGHLRGRSRPKIFPLGDDIKKPREESDRIAFMKQTSHGYNEGNDKALPSLRAKGDSIHNEFVYVSSAIDANYHKGPSKGYGGKHRQLVQVGNVDTKGHNSIWGRVYDPEGISATLNSEAGGLGAKTGLYRVSKGGDGRIHTKDDVSQALEAGCSGGGGTSNRPHLLDGESIRRLTPTECERLQGFPDGWTDGISDTRRYQVLGNAVSVPVVKEIILKLKEYL